MRVHNEIGAQSFGREGHVLLRHNKARHALLTVPGAELVTKLRPARRPEQHLDEEVIICIRGQDELIDVGNLDENGNIHAADDPRRAFHKGNLLWHSDVTFDPVRATYSLLAAHVVPPVGADTEFADMKAAYEDLPEETKLRVDGLTAEHSIWYSRKLGGMDDVSDTAKATRPPARHNLVNVNPRTGRKSLYLASHASHILEMSEAEGRALLDELTEHATQPRYVYRHAWRPGDVVMWDNLQTMHRGVPFDDVSHARDMRRVTVLEGIPA